MYIAFCPAFKVDSNDLRSEFDESEPLLEEPPEEFPFPDELPPLEEAVEVVDAEELELLDPPQAEIANANATTPITEVRRAFMILLFVYLRRLTLRLLQGHT